MNLFPLDRITGEHVHFMFVANFGKFVLDIVATSGSLIHRYKKVSSMYFLMVYFSSHKNMVQCVSLLIPLGNETSGFDICRCKLNYPQNRIYYSPLS